MGIIKLKFDEHHVVNYSSIVLVMSVSIFKIYLERRQFKFCSKSTEPPVELQGLVPASSYDRIRLDEMHRSELEVWKQCIYMICSMGELEFGFYPLLWHSAVSVGVSLGDEDASNITNTIFIFMFGVYLVLRNLMVALWDNWVLMPLYDVAIEDTLPLMGLLCTYAYVTIFLPILFLPVFIGLIFIEETFGLYFYFWIWLKLAVISVIAQVVLSLFKTIPFIGRQVPVPEGPLRVGLQKLMDDTGFSIKNVRIVYTYHVNRGDALFYGCLCLRRVIILDNLLYNQGTEANRIDPSYVGIGLSVPQVVAFVAHALGHWHNCHFYVVYFTLEVYLFIWFALFGLFYDHVNIFEAVGFQMQERPLIVAYILIYKFLFPPFNLLGNLILFWILRSFSYRADAYAAKKGYRNDLHGALLKQYQDYKYFPTCDWLYLIFCRRKPSLLKRLIQLKAYNEPNKDESKQKV